MIRAIPVPITLDPAVAGPLHRQIATRLRGAIATGMIAPGARLPATRVLATQLGIARGTVETAYAQLAGEGLVVTRGAAGTMIAPSLRGRVARLTPRAAAPPGAALPAPDPPRPFRLGLPALDMFPRTLWARLAAREARVLRPDTLAYPDPLGHRALREAVAAYLGLSRGIVCQPAQVLITGGYQGALTLVAHAVLRAGDSVWVEDPCYHLTRDGLREARAKLVPVPVDEAGMDVARAAAGPPARLAVVTPTHQSPMGVALGLPRRLELLAWAAAQGGWVLEDDYDGEFHYTGHPLPALKSLDRADRVIYAGSFSKVLFPGLRLGYVVVPERLRARLTRAAQRLQAGQPDLAQRTVAAFMRDGHFARHLRRMRALYAARRRALADALRERFADRVEIALRDGGMHLLARFALGAPDAALAERAEAAGLAPSVLSRLCLRRRDLSGLLLGFTNVAEEQARPIVERLATALIA